MGEADLIKNWVPNQSGFFVYKIDGWLSRVGAQETVLNLEL
jgi:hypothetical protein